MGSHGVSRGFTGVHTENYAEPVTLAQRWEDRNQAATRLSQGCYKVVTRMLQDRGLLQGLLRSQAANPSPLVT